jgi:hypothetical protein
MKKQQALNSNAEAAGAAQLYIISRCYTVLLKKQALHCNEEVAGTTL